jgi:hypothetical protein
MGYLNRKPNAEALGYSLKSLRDWVKKLTRMIRDYLL